jgi:hypothetical protein
MKPNEDLPLDDQQLVLGDLLNTVLDKGVVISGQVTISIADIDLVMLDLRLLLSSVQTALERQGFRTDGDVPLLRSDLSES